MKCKVYFSLIEPISPQPWQELLFQADMCAKSNTLWSVCPWALYTKLRNNKYLYFISGLASESMNKYDGEDVGYFTKLR